MHHSLQAVSHVALHSPAEGLAQRRTCLHMQVTRPSSPHHRPPGLQRNLLSSLDSETKKMPVIHRKIENTKVAGWLELQPGTWCYMNEVPPPGLAMMDTRVQTELWCPGPLSLYFL